MGLRVDRYGDIWDNAVSDAMQEDWSTYRRRMIAETERFIEWGLRHPDLVDWIPSKPVSRGAFPARVASWFYRNIFFKRR